MRCAATRFILAMAPLLLIACSRHAPEAEPQVSATVTVAAVALGDYRDLVVAYGLMEAASAQGHAVSLQVESQLAAVLVQQGETVRKGQPLLRLQPSAATSLEMGRAGRDALAAQVELQRLLRLREQGLATESELQAARALAESATALRDSLIERAGQGQGLLINAPASGVVDALAGHPGEVVAPGAVLVRVLAPTAQILRLGVEPDAISGIKLGAEVLLADLEDAAIGKGQVQSIDPRIDTASGLVTVLVRVNAISGMPAGTRVLARIIRALHAGVVGVPRSAVLFEGDQPFVFTVADGKARRREVSVGFRDGQQVEITTGLGAGEQVVVLGNDELHDGLSVNVAKAESGKAAP